MKFTLKNEEIAALNDVEQFEFPKYTSQLINLANQNAQGTRPAVVGQMSELFQQFLASENEKTVAAWRAWYTARHPDAIGAATDKICAQVRNLQVAVQMIDAEMVKKWVEDLVISKTFTGLCFQKAILRSLAENAGTGYRLANPQEEAAGIDVYVGNTAYSVKPISYKTKDQLPENIAVKMIFYEKTKTGLKIEVVE